MDMPGRGMPADSEHTESELVEICRQKLAYIASDIYKALTGLDIIAVRDGTKADIPTQTLMGPV